LGAQKGAEYSMVDRVPRNNYGPHGPNKSNKGRLACDVDQKIGRVSHRYF